MKPSGFQYAMVTSGSLMNGVSALYTFTLTLGVDTEINSVIEVQVPMNQLIDNQIVFDKTKPMNCTGLLNLRGRIRCSNKNDEIFLIEVFGSEKNVSFISNGTSVSFQLGYFKNPLSLRESQSFIVSTFITSDTSTNYYYYNREDTELTI